MNFIRILLEFFELDMVYHCNAQFAKASAALNKPFMIL